MVYMYHHFLIHSSADGHLGCFHVLAMINSTAKVSAFQMSIFSSYLLLGVFNVWCFSQNRNG